MKITLIIALSLLIFSCKDKVTYYKYNGVTVTRIDKDAESTFYYGEIKDEIKGHPFIKAEYSGLNNGLDAFIRFNSDSSVEVIHYGGEYLTQSPDASKTIYMRNYDNDELHLLLMTFKNHYLNIIRVSDAPEIERKWNIENKSKVITQKP